MTLNAAMALILRYQICVRCRRKKLTLTISSPDEFLVIWSLTRFRNSFMHLNMMQQFLAHFRPHLISCRVSLLRFDDILPHDC